MSMIKIFMCRVEYRNTGLDCSLISIVDLVLFKGGVSTGAFLLLEQITGEST